jgi:hypothetical protein
MKKNKKVRVNITVDKNNLDKAKTKLRLFGGKLSTLFDAYLNDFVKTIGKTPESTQEDLLKRIKILEKRVDKIEENRR